MPIPVVITAYADRTFSFVTKTLPASYFIMKSAKLKKGSQNPGKDAVGKISRAQLEEIAAQKMVDLNANDNACGCPDAGWFRAFHGLAGNGVRHNG